MSLAARLLALAAALLIMLPAGGVTAAPEPLPTPCGSGTALTPCFRVQLPHGPAIQVDPGHPGLAELLASSDGYLAYSGCVSPNSTTTPQIRDRNQALVETITRAGVGRVDDDHRHRSHARPHHRRVHRRLITAVVRHRTEAPTPLSGSLGISSMRVLMRQSARWAPCAWSGTTIVD